MRPTRLLAAVADGGVWADSSPSPSPLPQLEPTQVSPGLAGFLAIFAVAVACVLLFFGLSRQLRRMRHNAEVQGVGPDGPLAAADHGSRVGPGGDDDRGRDGGSDDDAPLPQGG